LIVVLVGFKLEEIFIYDKRESAVLT